MVNRQFIQEMVRRSVIQPFAARQKQKKRKGILLSLLSLINRLVIMGVLVFLLRWWLQRQDEEQLREQSSRAVEISLDPYEPGIGVEQPQTAPVQAPAPSGYESTWPEPEVALSQAEAAPVEELTDPERTGPLELDEVIGGEQAVPASVAGDGGAQEPGEGQISEQVPDDLTLIEGIGPKISSILNSAGIRTFRRLAGTEPSRIEEILLETGLRLADPATWPEQANLLANGDLEGLRQLQAQLKAGRRS